MLTSAQFLLQSALYISYCKEYLYVRNIFIPTLPSLWRLLLLHLIKLRFTSRYSLSVKSHSDFPKLCFFMLCYVTLFICLYSCPIQHVPAESACSAGEIRRLELVFTAYTLSIIARCWPEVQLIVPWRVRLLDRVDCFCTGLQFVRSSMGLKERWRDKFRLLVTL